MCHLLGGVFSHIKTLGIGLLEKNHLQPPPPRGYTWLVPGGGGPDK